MLPMWFLVESPPDLEMKMLFVWMLLGVAQAADVISSEDTFLLEDEGLVFLDKETATRDGAKLKVLVEDANLKASLWSCHVKGEELTCPRLGSAPLYDAGQSRYAVYLADLDSPIGAVVAVTPNTVGVSVAPMKTVWTWTGRECVQEVAIDQLTCTKLATACASALGYDHCNAAGVESNLFGDAGTCMAVKCHCYYPDGSGVVDNVDTLEIDSGRISCDGTGEVPVPGDPNPPAGPIETDTPWP